MRLIDHESLAAFPIGLFCEAREPGALRRNWVKKMNPSGMLGAVLGKPDEVTRLWRRRR